jgi:Ca2+-binding RTX toxin-like protein
MARNYRISVPSFQPAALGIRPVPIDVGTFDLIEGDDNANVLNGTAGVDTINGYGGNDVLGGLDGDDNLFGGAGADMLAGDAFGQSGVDTLYGGADADFIQGGNSVDTLYGGSGDDSLQGVGNAVLLTMEGPSDIIEGGGGIDRLIVNYAGFAGGGGAVGATVDMSTGSGEVSVNGFRGENFTNVECLDFVGPEGADVVTGGDYDDSISGNGGNDILRGEGGDDTIGDGTGFIDADGGDGFDGFTLQVFSNSSNVVIDGNAGTVSVNGAANGTFTNFEYLSVFIDASGNNTVSGIDGGACHFIAGGGNNTFVGGNQADVLHGHLGSDSHYGGGGGDSIDGASGTNTLDGGGGDDTISSGGTDTVTAGSGDDLVVVEFTTGAENSSFQGGGGYDELQFTTAFWEVATLDLSAESIGGFEALTDYVTSPLDYAITLTTAQFAQFQVIDMSSASSTLVFADDADVVVPDYAVFGTLQLAAGGQTVDFRGAGSDDMPLVLGSDGNDTVLGPGEWIDDDVYIEAQLGAGNDRYVGSFDGGDIVDGGDGKDRIETGKNHDDLTGGLGADTLDGGQGFDDFIYTDVAESTGANFDTIRNFDINDDEVIVPFDLVDANDPVVTGALSKATFNDDLKAAIGKQQLDIHHYVIFTPDAGDYAGQTFVIIEANDRKGYQKNADYVIRFDNPNFIEDGIGLFT